MKDTLEFEQIPDSLSLEEATAELVRYAKLMQGTHTNNSISIMNREAAIFFFDMRKTGMQALMNLIEQYLQQIPTTIKDDQAS